MCYTVLYYVTGREDQDRALQYYRQLLVTLRYRRGRPGQGVTVLPTVTGYTVLHFVTGGEDQDRALQYYCRSHVTLRYDVLHCAILRYRQGGPGQSVTVLPPVTCYTVLHCVTGGEDQDRALQYYRQSLVTLCYRRGGPGQSVTVLPAVTGGTQAVR